MVPRLVNRIVLDLNQSAFAPQTIAALTGGSGVVVGHFDIDPGFAFKMMRGSFGLVIANDAAGAAVLVVNGIIIAMVDSKSALLKLGLGTYAPQKTLSGVGVGAIYLGDDDFIYPQDYKLLGGSGASFGAMITCDVANPDAVPHDVTLYGNAVFEIYKVEG